MRIDQGTFHKHVTAYEAGQFIFLENESGTEMYVIIEGQVEIRKNTGAGSAKTLSVLGKGDLFGEMALIEKLPRSASAVAVQRTRCLAMDEALYESMIGTNPDFARRMNRLLSERIRKANRIIQDLMSTNRQAQVWDGLLAFCRQSGLSTYKGWRVNLPRFLQWASEHLGIGEKELQAILAVFLRHGMMKKSAAGNDEVLVERREGAAPAEPAGP